MNTETPVAWQDKNKPDELVASLDSIDPMYRDWYRPLYAHPQSSSPEPAERGIGTLLNAGRRALGHYHDGKIGLLVSAHDLADALAALIRAIAPERQPETKRDGA